MRRRFAAILLVMAMAATVVLRSGTPAGAHAVTAETCSPARAEGHTPYAAPPHEGRILLDIVSRANAAPLMAALPLALLAPPSGDLVLTRPVVVRRVPSMARRHIVPKRFRRQPGANDPA